MQIDLNTPIILASANPKKVAELRAIFAQVELEIESLADLGIATAEPEEIGRTFEQNATIKALGYAGQTGRVCLADDSGLEVDALGGAPGVISSHYCTDGHETGMTRSERDLANNQRLLRELEGVPTADRSARFICVMALASPSSSEVIITTRGTFEGAIGLPGDVPRGTNGFGYDPLFLVKPDLARTSAELDAETKNAMSHRGKAARAMAARIAAMRGA
ncbi:MAG: non-canonical purine NTP pyrophosphatase [Phycisphaerales bacterium]